MSVLWWNTKPSFCLFGHFSNKTMEQFSVHTIKPLPLCTVLSKLALALQWGSQTSVLDILIYNMLKHTHSMLVIFIKKQNVCIVTVWKEWIWTSGTRGVTLDKWDKGSINPYKVAVIWLQQGFRIKPRISVLRVLNKCDLKKIWNNIDYNSASVLK